MSWCHGSVDRQRAQFEAVIGKAVNVSVSWAGACDVSLFRVCGVVTGGLKENLINTCTVPVLVVNQSKNAYMYS